MIKRDELADPNSCLNRAGSDEPIFVLRAHDPNAAAVVRDWASRYLLRKIRANQKAGGRGLTPEQQAKRREAKELALAMTQWRTENVK